MDTSHYNYAAVGHRIKTLRKQFGMTQAQLAALAGIEQSSLSTIEHGGAFRADRLPRFAQALHTTQEYLLCGDGPALAGERPSGAVDAVVARLRNLVALVPPEMHPLLVGAIEGMASRAQTVPHAPKAPPPTERVVLEPREGVARPEVRKAHIPFPGQMYGRRSTDVREPEQGSLLTGTQ